MATKVNAKVLQKFSGVLELQTIACVCRDPDDDAILASAPAGKGITSS